MTSSTKTWDPEQIKIAIDPRYTIEQAARLTGRSYAAVRHQRYQARLAQKAPGTDSGLKENGHEACCGVNAGPKVCSCIVGQPGQTGFPGDYIDLNDPNLPILHGNQLPPSVGIAPEEEEEKTYEEDLEFSQSEHWQKRFNILAGKYRKALAANSVVNQLVAEIKAVAPTSYDPAPAIVTTRGDNHGTPQSAFLLLSDTHVGKVVEPSQTLGFGGYNFDIFVRRLKYLEESVISIRENHTTTHIEELVVAILGDMLDGALNHGVEAGQRSPLFNQYYGAAHAIAQFLRNLAAHFPVIRIKTVVGNHTRWQNQRKMPTENRFSNLDQFLYALVQALVADIQNIKFQLDTQPFNVFKVQGFTFHAAHGDHLRGGDQGLGIPSRAVARELSAKAQLYMKHGKQAPHYYVTGHLHREIVLPHTLGDYTVNGGFPGVDNYGLSENFSAVDPSQRFFFVHPKYGKTAEYGLSLKHADALDLKPYTIPEGFACE